MIYNRVKDIRKEFIRLRKEKLIKRNKSFMPDSTYEIMNASFIADEPTIFGTLDEGYAKKELDWYNTCDTNINSLEGPIPEMWKEAADPLGNINSNYGWCLFSPANYDQFNNAIIELRTNKNSRRSCMIYMRPTMYGDAYVGGMNDFMCMYAVQLLISDNKLNYLVFMRSNDAICGYKNDYFWHSYVFDLAVKHLADAKDEYSDGPLTHGNMYWNVGTLHIYPRHFHLIKE